MKKGFISLVAAAALVGGMIAYSTTQAGTVTTSGDTNISLYGFIEADFSWTKKMAKNAEKVYGNVAYEEKDGASADRAKQNKTCFHATTKWTRIGLRLVNKEANIRGKIETDFLPGSLRLRKAYLQYNLDNYFVRIGKDFNLLKQFSFSRKKKGMPGFGPHKPNFTEQIRFGSKFSLGSVTLIPELSFQEMKGAVINGKKIGNTYQTKVNRTTMPGVAGKLTAKVKTSFGSPIEAYVGYGYESVKIAYAKNSTNIEEKKKHPQIVTAGVKIPIQWLTLKGDYNWSKGATGFQALSYGQAYAPSFYVKDNDLNYTKANSAQIEARITPIPQFTAWGGYAQTKVKNAKDVVASKGKFAKKATGWFVGGCYKLTKVTRVQLEYDRFNTTWQEGQETNKYKGDQYALIFKYNF